MLYTELQTRSIETFNQPDYYEIKGGSGFQVNPKNQLFLGLGRYASYSSDRLSREEFRIWLQHTYSLAFEKLKIDHRTRAEKRFFYDPISHIYSNDERYRFRLAFTLPINHSKMTSKTFYINSFDEIFLGPHQELVKRNRIFGGIGFVFTEQMSTNLGYLWQRELSPFTRNIHFLYWGINFTVNKNSKEADHLNIVD